MSKFKFITLSILGILTLGLVSGCGPKEDIPTEFSRTNPRIINEISLESEPVKLKKPFIILTEEGETPEELQYENVTLNTNEFENLYEAIRIAGQNATNSNKLQVQDANFTQVFIRQRASNWFVFDGHDYVGTDASKGAKEYIDANSDAYAITGSGSQYAYLGREDYVSEMSLQENKLELNAGAYNYMFSKNGVGQGENQTNINGFSYVDATVRLSEMKYRPSTDGDGWNAYIFINLGAGISADLGLIGNLMGDTVQWRLFRNCQSQTHGSQGFHLFPLSRSSDNPQAETGQMKAASAIAVRENSSDPSSDPLPLQHSTVLHAFLSWHNDLSRNNRRREKRKRNPASLRILSSHCTICRDWESGHSYTHS